MEKVNAQLLKIPNMQSISWVAFQTQEQLLGEYWNRPESIPMAIIFHSNPMSLDQPLKYVFRLIFE